MTRRTKVKWIGALAIISILAPLSVVSLVSRSGDVGAFLVKEIRNYGGTMHFSSEPPEISARWKIDRDKNGFVLVVSESSFTAVDGFMRKGLGDPMQSGISDGDAKGMPYSNWAARDIGVAIISIGYPDRVEINCVRGMSGLNEMIDEMAKPWYKKIKLW